MSESTQILGIRFYTGELPGLLERTGAGGLIVVPSAPVLVSLAADDAHREALEESDTAVTDSGFMVLLWRCFMRERLIRISGLRYVRALIDWPEFRQPGVTFWIMPSVEEGAANRAWLAGQGIAVSEDDCYVAPKYAARGALSDERLLKVIRERRPRFVMINLGGGVQERLGFFLKRNLEKPTERPETGDLKPEDRNSVSPQLSGLRSQVSDPPAIPQVSDFKFQVSAPAYRPALICTGAAIAFLSGRQVHIPVWADRLYLGWLFRSLSAPTKFLPRYWYALRLVPLLWKYRERSVGGS